MFVILLASSHNFKMRIRHVGSFILLAWLIIAASGCTHVKVTEQRLVSKPNMLFSDSPVFNYQSRFISQIEPGSASDGGSQGTGCTTCQ
jgi:hypothetical protein